MATAKAKQYLVVSQEGDWLYTDPVPAETPEEAVEQIENSLGEGFQTTHTFGSKWRAWEVVGKPVDLEAVVSLKRS